MEFMVKQKRKYGTKESTSTLYYDCSEVEMTAILAKMGGRKTVFKEDTALSDADTVSTTVTDGLVVDSVVMKHSEAKTQFFSGYKPIVFDSSTKVTDIQALFGNHSPFIGLYETEKPDDVDVYVGSMNDLLKD